MLNKVKARHGIELPVEGWKKTRVLPLVLGSLAVLFVGAPLLAVLVVGILGGWAVPVAIGVAGALAVLYGAALFAR